MSELVARLLVRLVADWWRELVCLLGPLTAGVWLSSWGGGLVGLLVPLALAGLLVALPQWRGRVRGWLADGRMRRGWARACRSCGLGVGELVPAVLVVASTLAGYVLVVQVRPGQQVDDLVGAGSRLAACLGARALRVRADPDHAGRATVVVVLREAFTGPLLPAPLGGGPVDLDRVPVGWTETGWPWLLPLRGNHVLVAGATGSGKGSVLWSLVRALAPAVAVGVVRLWAVDPKGGMELGFGERLFTRFATDGERVAELLDDAVGLLRERAGRLRGVTRLHTPSVGDPLVVVLVDELAALTAYLSDKTLRARIDAALGVLLSQGRAVGVVVVGAVQDPRKDTVPLRGLFPVRVALRLAEAREADLVLGSGAHARGAVCEKVPLGLPGVGYVVVDGQPDPERVRACYVSDEEVRAVAARFPAPPSGAAVRPVDPGRVGGPAVPDVVGGSRSTPAATDPDDGVPGVGSGLPVRWVPDTSAFRPAGAVGPLLPEPADDASGAGGEWDAFAVEYRRRHRLDEAGARLPDPDGDPRPGDTSGPGGG